MKMHSSRPPLVARAPGRVNLIGDHTDYNGLPVFPMAIQKTVSIAFRVRADARCRVASEHREDVADFRLDEPRRPHGPGDWRNYVHAGSLVLEELDTDHPVGIDAEVRSDLPLAAGLSSSSALVVATGLALLKANGAEVDPLELSARFARAERYVGTDGGAMDQTTSMMARSGCALRIDFSPVRVRPVAVPDDWCFLVAHSGEGAEKSGDARALYNAKVDACRRALSTLRDVLERERGPDARRLARDYPTLLPHVDRELWDWALERLIGEEHDCFRHTVSEAQRVVEAERMMAYGDAAAFGRLMSASHESLASYCGVSTMRLDALVSAAYQAGALGARMTGAGLGGCMVALVGPAHAAAVEEALTRQLADWVEEPLVFRAQPSVGARVEERRPAG